MGLVRVSGPARSLALPMHHHRLGPPLAVGLQAGARGEQANQGIDPEPEQKEGIITATFDLDECRMNRAG